MKKTTLTILAITLILTGGFSTIPADISPIAAKTAHAQENNSNKEDLKSFQFNVNEILSLSEEDQPQEYFNQGEDGETPIVAFILSVINFALRIIGSIAIIILIIGGFMFMFAQGNQQKIDEAKDIVKYAIIGLLVTFLSYIIVITVQSLFISEGETDKPTTEQS